MVKQYLLAILLLLLPYFGWSYYQDITNNTPEGIKLNLSKIIENPDIEPAEALKNIEMIILNAEQERDKLKLHIGLIAKGQLLVKNNQPDDALIVLNAAYVNAMELGLEHHQNEAIRMLSEVHLWKELRIESQEYLHKGLVLSQILKDTLNTAWYFVNLVRVEQETGNIGRAMELALKAKSFFELTFDTVNQAVIMLELSSIHNKLGNYNSSQNCLNNAYWFIRSKNISSLRGDVLLAQSELYLLMGKVEEALANCEKSIEIFKTIENARLFASMSLLGEIYTQLNRYNQGEDILKKTIAEQKEINDQSGQAITYLRLANLYGASKNFTNAIKHYNYSIEHSTNVGLTDIVRQAYKGLWQVYGIMGNIKSAYENLYQYTRITDSLFNVQKISEAISIEENAIRQQHLLELQQKESELVKTKEQVTQQKKNQFLLFITIGLFSLVIVFIYREFKQNKRANELLTYQKKEIEKQKSIAIQKTRNFTDSLNYAQRIQQAILRSSLRIHNLFDEAFIINYPKDIVSGDFYWISEKNERILFALADCTGHGVPGSLMSIIGTYGLNRIVNELNITSPSEILNQINILFDESLKQKEGVEIFDGMDIALCSYNPKSKELKYSGANIPLHVCRSNLLPQPSNAIIAKDKSSSIFSVKPTKQAIGSFFETKSFTNHSITLMEGDIIYLFTDGYVDQFGGPEGRKYKSAQLYKFLLGISSLQLEEQKKMLEENFTTWKGKLNQIDDVSFMGIKI